MSPIITAWITAIVFRVLYISFGVILQKNAAGSIYPNIGYAVNEMQNKHWDHPPSVKQKYITKLVLPRNPNTTAIDLTATPNATLADTNKKVIKTCQNVVISLVVWFHANNPIILRKLYEKIGSVKIHDIAIPNAASTTSKFCRKLLSNKLLHTLSRNSKNPNKEMNAVITNEMKNKNEINGLNAKQITERTAMSNQTVQHSDDAISSFEHFAHSAHAWSS